MIVRSPGTGKCRSKNSRAFRNESRQFAGDSRR